VAEIVLDTVDVTVFGPPSEVVVSLDFGAQGDDGSKIWAGDGDPSITLSGQPIKINDLYINTKTNEVLYGWLYQYLLQIGSPVWTPILQLNPSQFSTIATSTFTAGSTTINIPITSLTANTGTSIGAYTIRYSIAGGDPVASAMTVSIVGTDIRIVIKAVKSASGVWSDLDGSVDTHLFISYLG